MRDYELVGPFDTHRVLVGGRRVPFLEAIPANGGIVHMLLDRRYGLDISVADAGRVIPFIADCIAIGLGYTCHPSADEEPLRADPFPRSHGIERMDYAPGTSSAGG